MKKDFHSSPIASRSEPGSNRIMGPMQGSPLNKTVTPSEHEVVKRFYKQVLKGFGHFQ